MTPKSLVGLGRGYPASVQRYLQLPFQHLADLGSADPAAEWQATYGAAGAGLDKKEWLGLYTLNKNIIGTATDPYDITLHIEEYLRKFYTYNLTPPSSTYPSPYAAFLFDTHIGYCQHFAGAMALLLRFNGIPARVAVGFATGEPANPALSSGGGPSVYTVSTNNAHSWVEAYFPGAGWLPFDPTPGRSIPTAGASSTSPGFANPFAQQNGTASSQIQPPPASNRIPEASPTSSISPVRMHFCTLVRRFPSGCFSPSKYGTSGCMPAVVNNTVGSFSGIKDAEEIILCPLLVKKSKYF